MTHTVLLIQAFVKKIDSRIWNDYDNVNQCLEGVIKIYEEHLKIAIDDSDLKTITYDVGDLFNFIDQLGDISCLVYSRDTGAYEPHSRDWIKEEIYMLLRKQAQTS